MVAPVSRMEMKVAFSLVLKRSKNIRLAEKNDYHYLPGFTLRALEKMYIEFDSWLTSFKAIVTSH